MTVVDKFREYRSKKLGGIGKILLKIGITPHILTSFSLISGILAIYFLFNNYLLFFLFSLLHLLLDGLDGVVARLSRETIKGKYFDLSSDALITLMALVKVALFLQDYFALILSFLFLIAIAIHIVSKLEAPILFLRTTSLLVLFVATHPIWPYQQTLLTLGYLAAGATSLYSLTKQLQWFVSKRHSQE